METKEVHNNAAPAQFVGRTFTQDGTHGITHIIEVRDLVKAPTPAGADSYIGRCLAVYPGGAIKAFKWRSPVLNFTSLVETGKCTQL